MKDSINIAQNAGESRPLRHLVFWSIFLLLDIFQFALVRSETLLSTVIFNVSALIPQIAFTYVLAYGIIPRLLDRKTRIPFIVVFLIVLYVFAAFNRIFIVYVAEELVIPKPFHQEPIAEIFTDWKALLKRYIPSNLWVAMIFISIKYFFDQERINKRGLQLDKQRAESELKALKAQLNPHFLFNTLNNIYSLSVSNSPKTSDSISKLSDILDHVLYRSEGDLVPLSSEMELIRNYIELEQLRYDERLHVKVVSEIQKELEIPPLILLSLVENAFKHGAGEDSGTPEIDILVKTNEAGLRFIISNSVAGGLKGEIRESIGMSNLRKQLQLIYQNGYDLDISRSEGRFTVNLLIPEDPK